MSQIIDRTETRGSPSKGSYRLWLGNALNAIRHKPVTQAGHNVYGRTNLRGVAGIRAESLAEVRGHLIRKHLAN